MMKVTAAKSASTKQHHTAEDIVAGQELLVGAPQRD